MSFPTDWRIRSIRLKGTFLESTTPLGDWKAQSYDQLNSEFYRFFSVNGKNNTGITHTHTINIYKEYVVDLLEM